MEKERIRQAVLAMGADVCGFAEAGRFADAPEGCRPEDVFMDCQTVIVYGVALPKGLLSAPSQYIYAHFNGTVSVPAVDSISFRLARLLEQGGGVSVPLPCDTPVTQFDLETNTKRGILSMKHAAVLAGIGQLGKSTLLLSPEFGNRLTVGAVLTSEAFASDPYAESICITSCRLCLDACPARAIQGDGSVIQQPCREQAYVPDALGYTRVMCNRCRTVCPMRFGK